MVQTLSFPRHGPLATISHAWSPVFSIATSGSSRSWAHTGDAWCPYDKIPKLLIKAVLAAEDAQFFQHQGLDYLGMVRAFFANMRAGGFVQGGSTITQQVVKTFFLSPERTLKRKVQEVILARRLESERSKEEILHLYLNQIYFGHGRYGVQEASRFFFGVDVSQLSLAECALLAGLPKGPEALSPLKHPKRAKRRQAYVLRRMSELNFVSADVARTVVEKPIRVVRRKRPYYNSAHEFTDLVRKQLSDRFGEDQLDYLGLDVHTTLDAKLQQAARQAVQWGLRTLDDRQGYRRGKNIPKAKLEAALKRLRRVQTTFRAGRHYMAVVTHVDDAGQTVSVDFGGKKGEVNVDSARYNPQQHTTSKRFRQRDLIRVFFDGKSFVYDAGPQAALIAIDPRTGDVLAMVGGYHFRRGGFNRAWRAQRQPGSAFKPFVYGAALLSGRYTPATIVDDVPVVVKGGGAKRHWEPKNFDGINRGPLRLREALAYSVNTVAARLIDDVGVVAVQQLAKRAGITSPLSDDMSLALGSSAVTPVELTAAYCAIAGGGRRVVPRLITRLNDKPEVALATEEAMPPATAYVLTQMMRSVVEDGTARRARQLRRPVAGKTGTANELKDAWFVGFSPELAVGVWVGFDRPKTIGRKETGGRAALPIWVRFMREALRGQPKMAFRQPPGVVVQRIDPKSGLLARAETPDALEEVFVSGTEPKEQVPPVGQVDPSTILMNPGVQ